MTHHKLAGQPAPAAMLANIPRLVTAYFNTWPDPAEPAQRVVFGTSGHRGSALSASFNERHILAVTQAVCDYRRSAGINGPLFLGMDTHALSEPAFATALEVLAANGVAIRIDARRGYTPTPVVSHAILAYNRGRSDGLADGIVITPSHNPPEDGGIKYNPPHGGPSEGEISGVIERNANRLLADNLKGVARMPFEKALSAPNTAAYDFIRTYVADLEHVIDMQTIRQAGVRIGVDPLGGAAVAFWEPIAERYGLDITVVNKTVDPAFGFMSLDWDGKIRMDCSSPHAMSGLIALRDRFDIAFGNDTDADRHGIVTPSAGLLNPNHYLAVAIDYLYSHREHWPNTVAIGKTLVSSGLIDRVASGLGRRLYEVPVGFKWFVSGLRDGSLGFAGEESAGATFLRRDGSVWTTDKDGLILGLLAAEIKAKTGRDPGERYSELTSRYGTPFYARIDAPATPEQKSRLGKLSAEQVSGKTLAGEKIEAKLTHAPGDGNAIGGLKVVTQNGWFAARPSGTENIYKLYAESFVGAEHLQRIQTEARELITTVLSGS